MRKRCPNSPTALSSPTEFPEPATIPSLRPISLPPPPHLVQPASPPGNGILQTSSSSALRGLPRPSAAELESCIIIIQNVLCRASINVRYSTVPRPSSLDGGGRVAQDVGRRTPSAASR